MVSPVIMVSIFSRAAFVALISVTLARGADSNSTNHSHGVLLTDPLGKLVVVPTNQIPAGLLPPPQLGLRGQTPTPLRGMELPSAVQKRLREAQRDQKEFKFFPSAQPLLMPYLAAQDEFG